jgi:hypothetical protein
MGGVDKYPYPKATWSPSGGWWHEVKNWKSRTGLAVVTITAIMLPLAYYSNSNHVKFPSEEYRKQRASARDGH